MRLDGDEDLEALADRLEKIVLEVREMARNRSRDKSPRPPPPAEKKGARVGRRVRITVRDKYYGHCGTILGSHGWLFWDIRLDPLDGGAPQVIYKKASSFLVIDDN
jgi:hypothetical protein